MAFKTAILPNSLLKKNCYLCNSELKVLLHVLAMSVVSAEGDRLKVLKLNKKKFIESYWEGEEFKDNYTEARENVFKLIKSSWLNPSAGEILTIFSKAIWNKKDDFFTVIFSEPFLDHMKIKAKGFNKTWTDFSKINLGYISENKGAHAIKLVFKLMAWSKEKTEFARYIGFEEMKEILQVSQQAYLKRGKFSPSLFRYLVLIPAFKKIEYHGEFYDLEASIDNKRRVFLLKWKKRNTLDLKESVDIKENKDFETVIN